MIKHSLLGAALLFSTVAACGSKPKAQSTTHTTTTTTDDQGNAARTDTEVKTTEHQDGKVDTVKSETTKTTTPAPPTH